MLNILSPLGRHKKTIINLLVSLCYYHVKHCFLCVVFIDATDNDLQIKQLLQIQKEPTFASANNKLASPKAIPSLLPSAHCLFLGCSLDRPKHICAACQYNFTVGISLTSQLVYQLLPLLSPKISLLPQLNTQKQHKSFNNNALQ